jgi:monoamine oxidase
MGEPVTAVRHDSDRVRVDTPFRSIDADAVVLACSLVPLRTVDFDPPLDPLLQSAIDRLGYGTVTKTAVQFAARQWQPGYATVEGISQRIYEPTVDQPGAAGVLMSYAGGDGGRLLAAKPEHDRVTLVEAEMRAVHGITAPALGSFSRAWSTDPWFGGAYAAYGPGQVTAYWEVLRRAHGRMWLAGEHAATWTGYLEGAVESGESVAEAILAAS